jgi:probable F420-dependent oxidoreductase
MKFGIFTMNAHSCSEPDTALAVALAAEATGFESLWCGEHVVMVEPAVGREPLGPRDPILDPIVALAHLAAATSTIRLGTGVVILPLRNPLVLAKQLASVDVLSKGRLIFGYGVGWLEPEFEAVGVPFDERGELADEYVEAMIALWRDDAPSFEGAHVAFAGVQCRPQPVQRPHPQLVVGGRSGPALRRAARVGHGWFGGLLYADDVLADDIKLLRQICGEVDRPQHLGSIEITASVKNKLTPERVAALESSGVSRLILLPPPGVHHEGLVEWVERSADELELTPPARSTSRLTRSPVDDRQCMT